MSITAKALVGTKYASGSVTLEYTVPSSTRTIIDKFTATNTDSSARTLTVHIVPLADSQGAQHTVVKAKSIAADETFDFTSIQNQILNAGDKFYVTASVGSVVTIRLSGREVA